MNLRIIQRSFRVFFFCFAVDSISVALPVRVRAKLNVQLAFFSLLVRVEFPNELCFGIQKKKMEENNKP